MEIRKLEIEDLPLRVELLNNPLISHFLHTGESFTLENTEKWFKRIKNDLTRYDVCFEKENKVIGMGGLTSISYEDQNAQLYIYLSPDFQGRGYGKLAVKLLCRLGFITLNLNKIYLYTFASNNRANKLYEGCGFEREGILREHTYKEGELHDRYIYGLFKNKFLK